MPILILQHIASEGPCQIGRILRDTGHDLRFIHLYDSQPPELPAALDEVDGIVSMGGPMNVEDAPKLPWLAAEMDLLRKAHAAKVPIVGLCLGAQLIAAALGGEVKAMSKPEIGWHNVRMGFAGTTDPILAGLPWNTTQFHLHGQEVTKLPPPPESAILAGSAACPIQAFRVGLTTYGFQYHFEWTLSDLAEIVKDPFITQSGSDPRKLLDEAAQHYDNYRRLGDRVCTNLAELLFPVLKK